MLINELVFEDFKVECDGIIKKELKKGLTAAKKGCKKEKEISDYNCRVSLDEGFELSNSYIVSYNDYKQTMKTFFDHEVIRSARIIYLRNENNEIIGTLMIYIDYIEDLAVNRRIVRKEKTKRKRVGLDEWR